MSLPMNYETVASNRLSSNNVSAHTHIFQTGSGTVVSNASTPTYSVSSITTSAATVPSAHHDEKSRSLAYPYQHLPAKPKLGTYEIDQTIGKGIFSVVKLARHTITGIYLAIKIIDKTCLDAENLVKVYRESVILKKLHHPNIVKLFQVMETPRLLCLVMEYLPNGEVFDYIATHGRFSEAQARVKFLDVLSAVDYAHSCGIVHRDLKAENLLFDAEMNIKLIDFSFGTHHSESPDSQSLLTTWCGSPPYAAPEIFKGEPYVGAKADIWSLGVVLYVMVCGMLPFDAQPLPHLRNQVLSASFRVPYWLSITCERLIRSMLAKVPSKRPSTRELFQHPWFIEPLPKTAPPLTLSHCPPISLAQCADSPVTTVPSSTALTAQQSRQHLTSAHLPHALSDPLSRLSSLSIERGGDLAADLEVGNINEFVLLIMESYGMNRSKILESLNSRAYDHLMATYLLLGEKVRQHRYSLNLPALTEALSSSGREDEEENGALTRVMIGQPDSSLITPHPKHSRVDSAVDMKGSEYNSNETSVASMKNISYSDYAASTAWPPVHRTHPVSVDAAPSDVSPLESTVCATNYGQSVTLSPSTTWTSTQPSRHANPETYAQLTQDSEISSIHQNVYERSDAEAVQAFLIMAANNRSEAAATDDEVTMPQPRRTLARRKYGVFTPPACLDQLARAVLAQQPERSVDVSMDDSEDHG